MSEVPSAFFSSPAAGGIVLIIASAAAIIVANSPLREGYEVFLKYNAAGLSVEHWINDALMAVFFMMVGLEIKRELLTGQLATWGQRALPGFAALGGMAVPAAIYVWFNAGSDETLAGWAIPAATDIAFAARGTGTAGQSRTCLAAKFSCRRWLFWTTWAQWLLLRSSIPVIFRF